MTKRKVLASVTIGINWVGIDENVNEDDE